MASLLVIANIETSQSKHQDAHELCDVGAWACAKVQHHKLLVRDLALGCRDGAHQLGVDVKRLVNEVLEHAHWIRLRAILLSVAVQVMLARLPLHALLLRLADVRAEACEQRIALDLADVRGRRVPLTGRLEVVRDHLVRDRLSRRPLEAPPLRTRR